MPDQTSRAQPKRSKPLSLWITRSEPGATILAAAVAAAGHVPIKAPVLKARSLHFTPPEGQFDAVLFLSGHSVRLALPQLQGCFASAYAVGRSTAAALHEAGVPAKRALIESSEGLLALLPHPARLRILLVTGAGGRNLLAPTLRARGAEVVRLDVYERLPLRPNIDPRAVDAIVVSSGDGFRQAVQVWLGLGGARTTPVLAPSSRVAALGSELGLANVVRCQGAGPEAVLTALRQMEWADD